ncbi:phage tail protein [Rhodococcus hoagii]|nr:phage tail protein [Prescottella equi]
MDAEAARLGVTGALYVGKVGITVPTAMAAWGSEWEDLGYISGDGITESTSEDRTDFTPWQAMAPIRTEVTSAVTTFQATLWETNFNTISLYYRKSAADMTVTPGTAGKPDVVSFTEGGKPKRDLRAFGVDVVDGIYARRVIAPLAEVTERGDLVYKSDTLIGYEVTITAYPGADGVSVIREFREGWSVPETP